MIALNGKTIIFTLVKQMLLFIERNLNTGFSLLKKYQKGVLFVSIRDY
jgi:hypothetical protein